MNRIVFVAAGAALGFICALVAQGIVATAYPEHLSVGEAIRKISPHLLWALPLVGGAAGVIVAPMFTGHR